MRNLLNSVSKNTPNKFKKIFFAKFLRAFPMHRYFPCSDTLDTYCICVVGCFFNFFINEISFRRTNKNETLKTTTYTYLFLFNPPFRYLLTLKYFTWNPRAHCSRGRVVKASDSKSDSLWERRFESYRLRYLFFTNTSLHKQLHSFYIP